jgi:hypothetical protein
MYRWYVTAPSNLDADGTEALEVAAPGGYKFLVANADTQGTVMTELCLSSSNVEKSVGECSAHV